MAQKYYADRNAKVVARRVNDARSRLEDLEQRQIQKPPRQLQFLGLLTDRTATSLHAAASGPVLTVTQVALSGRLAPISLAVSAGEKWLVTGPNGSGKSTLLHLLAGDLRPTSGAVDLADGIRVGMLTQEIHLPDPHDRGPDRTASQMYQDLVGSERTAQVPLATFGLLAGRDEQRPVSVLSVGQQRRLALAVLLADPPDVLLLDEPTNHLSLLLVTQLEAALDNYPGSVIIASHDRWLRRKWSNHSLSLDR